MPSTEKNLKARYNEFLEFIAEHHEYESSNHYIRFANALVEGDTKTLKNMLKKDNIECEKKPNQTPLVQGLFFDTCTALEIAFCANKVSSAVIVLQNKYWTITQEVIQNPEFFSNQADKYLSPSYIETNDDLEVFKKLVGEPRRLDNLDTNTMHHAEPQIAFSSTYAV